MRRVTNPKTCTDCRYIIYVGVTRQKELLTQKHAQIVEGLLLDPPISDVSAADRTRVVKSSL